MLNVVEIWNLKNELIKTLSHMLKQCLKEVIYEYILAFAGWRFIFWEMVGSGGYILAGGGWWVMVVIFWMVLGGGRLWWVVEV